MKNKKFTHEAYMLTINSWGDITHRDKILLRETKTMFVSRQGKRFRKPCGYVFGRRLNLRLEMASIVKL